MRTSSKARFLLIALLTFAVGVGMLIPAHAAPAPVRLQARLIWGTNEKIDDASLKQVEPALCSKLRNIFKWQSYWEVSSKPVAVSLGKPQSVKLSDDCTVDVKQLSPTRIEVKLSGKGRHVVTQTFDLRPGTPLLIGGDDKNNTAWFVVLTPSADKA